MVFVVAEPHVYTTSTEFRHGYSEFLCEQVNSSTDCPTPSAKTRKGNPDGNKNGKRRNVAPVYLLIKSARGYFI